jgi:hypothetical protein
MGADFSLKGCQIVAGGRSVAQTTGNQRSRSLHPEGVPPVSLTPFQGVRHFRLMSGGLRFAATTGYYLTALQAEAVHLPFEAYAISGILRLPSY